MSGLAAKTQAPSAQELFQRLSDITSDMAQTCAQVEDSLSHLNALPGDASDASALQNLDRMTQNLVEIAKLLERLSTADDKIERTDITAALQVILLPSLKTYLQDGETQSDCGSIDLF